jgi:hypothetical protein
MFTSEWPEASGLDKDICREELSVEDAASHALETTERQYFDFVHMRTSLAFGTHFFPSMIYDWLEVYMMRICWKTKKKSREKGNAFSLRVVRCVLLVAVMRI